MHELAIAEAVIATIAEKVPGERVTRVVLEIGRLSSVVPDAVRFCFDLCAEGTVVQGAALEIVEVRGSATCHACGTELSLLRPFGRCFCGSADLTYVAGNELRVPEVEVAAR